MSFINKDGVLVRVGLDAAKKAPVSSVKVFGDQRVIDVDISAANLPAFGSTVTASRYVKIPANSLVEKVELSVEVAFTGASATLSVGCIDAEGDTPTSDVDAFLNAATTAELTSLGLQSGTSSPLDGSGVGVKYTKPQYITWTVGTADFTAGKGKLRIWYSTPDKTVDELGK